MDRLRIALLLLLAGSLCLVGCGDDDASSDDSNEVGDDAGPGGSSGRGGDDRDGGGSAGNGAGSGGNDDGGPAGGSGGSGGGGTGSDDCPAIDERDEELVSGEIAEDTTWSCDTLYILTDLTFVTENATLTIEPGTVVQGDSMTALIITRGAQLESQGEADAPVVFTSSQAEGSRLSGDWGGVILLGGAEINVAGGENQIEGIDPTDPRGVYGGDDNASNCGSVKYTRIEFTGYELMQDFELQGLTMGGCGSDTEVSYVQIHRSKDDGIEIFGGRPNLDHIVLTGNEDDSFDTAEGYLGNVQFMVAQQIAPEADTGFEFDNQEGGEDAEPRNMPTIYNTTLIGTGSTSGTFGMILRRGTAGIMRNIIVMGFPSTGVDIRDATTIPGTESLDLTIENSIFFENGADDMTHFSEGETDNDDMFDEAAFLTDAARENVVDEDPELADPYNVTDPDFVPAAGSPAADGAATPPSGFDATATYIGAFEPGGDDWTEGWTAYPED